MVEQKEYEHNYKIVDSFPRLLLSLLWLWVTACDASSPRDQSEQTNNQGEGISSNKVHLGKQADTLQTATFEICNTAPYKVKYLVYRPTSPFKAEVEGWKELEVGQCQNSSAEFRNIDPVYYVYAENSGSERLLRLIYKIPVDDPDDPKMSWEGTDTQQCISSRKSFVLTDNSNKNSCSFDQDLVGFSIAQKTGQASWHFSLFDTKVDGTFPENWEKDWELEQRLEVTKLRAQLLHKALQRQIAFQDEGYGHELSNFLTAKERLVMVRNRRKILDSALQTQTQFNGEWFGKEFPYSLGTEIYDPIPDGHIVPDVVFGEVVSQTIFDKQMHFQPGDVLKTFNGETVFSASDLYILLHEHATSRAKGINTPYTYVISRKIGKDWKLLTGSTTYAFNEKFWGVSGEDKFFALVYGGEDALAMGANALGHCSGKRIGKGLLNTLIWVGNQGIEQLNKDFQFGLSEIESYQFENFNDCHWRTSQHIARLQQEHSDLYANAAWIGIMTPSGVRLLFSRSAKAYMTGKLGSKLVGRAVATAGLETLETIGWTIISSRPGSTRTQETIRDLKQIVPLAAGLGFFGGVLSRR